MLESFEETTAERGDNDQLWIRNRFGRIVCEAFFRSEGETQEEMLNNGYILVPYRFEGQDVYVEVASEG